MNKKESQPNVIVFFTDQQRWDTTGTHGNPLDLTPNFDRMAKSGTDINLSFTCQPVCGPARSSLQTGLYPTQNGCFRNEIPLSPQYETLGHYFSKAGYNTSYIGKWHLADKDPVPIAKRGGYEYWKAANNLEFTSDAYDTVLYNNNCEQEKLPGYRVDALTDEAIRYINNNKHENFFMFISYLEPHHQNHSDNYPPPLMNNSTSNKRSWIPGDLAALGGVTFNHIEGYYGMVKRLDEALGRLQEALKSLNIEEETIILFTSDHGNHFKTRNDEYKRSCHESSIRVPTAITGSEFIGGGEISELVSLIDLPPTILDAAGISIPKSMQGRSVLPLVKKENVIWPQEVLIQISESEVGRALRTKKWKYSVADPEKNGWDHASSDYYVEKYLYDLESDPYELENLIGYESHVEIAYKLRERLKERIIASGEPEPIINEAPLKSAGANGQRRVSIKEYREDLSSKI